MRRAPGYKVSSEGRVRSVDRTLSDGRAAGGVLLTPVRDRHGHWYVTINGARAHVAVLVLEAFVSLRPWGMEACHGPGGSDDNSVTNLRWDTHLENMRDKKRDRKRKTDGETSPSPQATSRTKEGTLVTLVDAVDQGIISCSLVAARKAVQRPGFPPKAGVRGMASVWDAGDLAAWEQQ